MEHLVNSKNPLVIAVYSRIEDLEQFSGCRADELHFKAFDDDEQELTERQIAVIVQEIREFVGSRSEVELMEELTNEYC